MRSEYPHYGAGAHTGCALNKLAKAVSWPLRAEKSCWSIAAWYMRTLCRISPNLSNSTCPQKKLWKLSGILFAILSMNMTLACCCV